jgi:hypothetical protein
MTVPYNLTQITDQVGLYGMITAVNDMSGGLFGMLILITFYIIMLFAWKDYDIKSTFAGASFLTALIAIFLRLLQWIPDQYMFGTFIIAGISFAVLKWS